MGLVNGGQTLLKVNPSSLNFGNVVAGQTATLGLQIQNPSANNAINISGTDISLPEFSLVSIPSVLNPHTTRTINLIFTAPASAGTFNGTFTINSDADNDPVIVGLLGVAIAAGPGAVSVNPSAFIFPPTKTNTVSPSQQFTVTNTGSANVDVQIPIIAIPFASADLPAGVTTLGIGQSFSFDVTFNPTGGGYVLNPSGITINHDAPNSPFLVDLEGNGVAITPAYIVTGGTENGYAAFGRYLNEFNATNFSCEDPATATKVLQLAGPGVEARLQKVEMQFEDMGPSAVNVAATVKRYNSSNQSLTVQTSNQSVSMGTGFADSTVLNCLADLEIQGELITLVFTPVGPLFLASYTPRFTEGGEVIKT